MAFIRYVVYLYRFASIVYAGCCLLAVNPGAKWRQRLVAAVVAGLPWLAGAAVAWWAFTP